MYNLRYHLASLVSVFLALAVGLVLGGLAVGRGAVDRQQAALVEDLQTEFSQLRDENRDLQAENRLLTGFSADMVQVWSAERLAGRTIVIVTNAGRDDGLAAATEAIESAGGQVAVARLMEPGLGAEDDSGRATLASLAPDPEDVAESITASLAAEWTGSGTARPMTQALVQSGLLRFEGLGDEVGATGLVTIASSQGEPDPVGIRLAEQFAAAQGIGIGAESMGAETGVANAAADAGLPAFDTLGSQIGRYSLVALLTGGDGGYFGLGAGARAPYPDPAPQ